MDQRPRRRGKRFRHAFPDLSHRHCVHRRASQGTHIARRCWSFELLGMYCSAIVIMIVSVMWGQCDSAATTATKNGATIAIMIVIIIIHPFH